MLSRTLLLVAWFPTVVCAQQLTPVDRQDRLMVAAGVWSESRYNYAYWDVVRADWDSAFTAVVTETAGRSVSDVQYFRHLRRFVALLADPQAELVPPPALATRVARPPLEVRSIERRPFIIDYAQNDEMRIARPQRLAEILAIQGIPAEQWLRDSVLPEIPGATDATRWERAVQRMLEGEKGTALHLLLRLPGGEQRGASVTRSVSLNARWPLEPPVLDVDTLPGGGGALWVRVSSLADADVVQAFDHALRGVGDAPRASGIVLDLREASGTGAGRENGYAILAQLIERPVLTSRWRTPQYRPAYRGADAPDSSGAWLAAPSDTIRPRQGRSRFTGPVAILSSPRTAGAAEDLLVAFRNAARGPIIGETSAGSTGQALLLPLRRGWQLRVTVTRDAFPDGAEFARTGVTPDMPVTVRVDDVLAGRDVALDRAREYLKAAPRR